MTWKPRKELDGATTFGRPGLLGGPGCGMDNVHEVTNGFNYSGSGGKAFGGADKWPVVTARVSLPAGREDLAAALASGLRAFVDKFVALHGLEVK